MREKIKKVPRTATGAIKRDMFYGFTDKETRTIKAYMAKEELSVASLFRKLARIHIIESAHAGKV